jgi:hypothetical protein
VFSIALSLTLGALSPTSPVSSAASGAAIAVCFAPEKTVRDRVGDIVAMPDRPLRRLFWRVADALDYLLTLTRLHILDALPGPDPEADRQRSPGS